MAPDELDRARIERFLDRAVNELRGDWILVGGAAAAVWFIGDRVTQDIDLVGSDGTNAERLQLMAVADAEGLPIETVNTGADYFIRRINGWNTEVVELRRSSTATIFRPTATMYLLLKISRLSEQDLADCVALVAWCASHGESLDGTRVRAALAALPATADTPLLARRDLLATALA